MAETRNDGSKVETTYDRLTGKPVKVATGAGAVSYMSYDAVGREVRMVRPNNRGETLYAYDLDGRLREQVTKTESTDWTTRYSYDAIGRPIRVDYQDGSFATTTYNADSTVASSRTRDGLTLAYSYDAANRPVSVVPSGTPAATLAPLDSGNETSWDALSRSISLRRGDGPEVRIPGFDLGSRPAEERVGDRQALGWAWDIYNRPIETRLPLGPGRDDDVFAGFRRQYNTLDQLTSIDGLGFGLQTSYVGAKWSWGGSGRLWDMTTNGILGTAVRYGYIGGAGAQPPSGAPDSKWQLGTMTWGSMPGADPEFTATQSPTHVWGRFGFGYRGHDGDPRDGAKMGRLAMSVGNDLFAGIGWSGSYDAGVRLSGATPGRGELQGTPDAEDPGFRYQYGKGDELQRIVDEAAGKATGVETGAYGRFVSRNGSPFVYDSAGRRTEDDRFKYKWNWRGELVEVLVKASRPEGQESPFAGHLVRYQYDAQGRLNSRSHFGPEGSQLLEKRVYVWEGQSLLAEAAYQDEAETEMLWRKTYVPGPSGLDDAIQVKVDNIAAPLKAGSRLYTYLRDELGTVIGVVGEEEGNNPAKPTIPARYLYTPYGEAHIEKSLEIRSVHLKESEFKLNQDVQQISDPDERSYGALTVTFAAALEASSLQNGVVAERYSVSEWVKVPEQDLLVGYEDATELKVLVKEGWLRESYYRVRLTGIQDKQGRGLGEAKTFPFRIAVRGFSSDFSKTFAVACESAIAALDTLGGRFPGGQSSLFQGLWTDPVTGISYARARWFDARNAGGLSEDPLQDVDSPNLYAFVGWSPRSGVDPLGEEGADVRFPKTEQQLREYRQRQVECAANPECRKELEYSRAVGEELGRTVLEFGKGVLKMIPNFFASVGQGLMGSHPMVEDPSRWGAWPIENREQLAGQLAGGLALPFAFKGLAARTQAEVTWLSAIDEANLAQLALMAVVRVRRPGKSAHLRPIGPCSSCSVVIEYFEIQMLSDAGGGFGIQAAGGVRLNVFHSWALGLKGVLRNRKPKWILNLWRDRPLLNRSSPWACWAR